MSPIGFPFPSAPRRTALYATEEDWYLPLLSKQKNIPLQPVKRSNFGQYDMAVNYLTTVLEEARAINTVAVYNIDHMAQIEFAGADAATLLHRTVGANILEMKIGQCKYTLLLNDKGGVQDDMIIMKLSDTRFIMVINAGHDITGTGITDGHEHNLVADVDRIMQHRKPSEAVTARDISAEFVKIDIQGPYAYKLIKTLYGEQVLKNRYQPDKNMNFFTFNKVTYDGHDYIFSRTGYTNRWGWEIYVPVAVAEVQFKRIVTEAINLGGLLVGLGGRDENRISAGASGLPLMGQEYDPAHTPVNCPLFEAAIDLTKDGFIGKRALERELHTKPTKKQVLFITEGIVTGRVIYKDSKRLGSVTSSINSPNVSQEKREAIGSQRKNVNAAEGIAAIGLGWLYASPFAQDAEGRDITEIDGKPVRLPVEFYREDEEHKPVGSPVIGYITAEGVNPATAPKALKNIESL